MASTRNAFAVVLGEAGGAPDEVARDDLQRDEPGGCCWRAR